MNEKIQSFLTPPSLSVPVSVLLPGLAYSIAPLQVKVNAGVLHLYCKSLVLFLICSLIQNSIRAAFSWLFGILTCVLIYLVQRTTDPNFGSFPLVLRWFTMS